MYLLFKFLHISGAIVSLGAMLGVVVLGWATREGEGEVEALRARFEGLVSAGGMVLVAAGAALVHLRGWGELVQVRWLPAALALLVVGALVERRYARTLPLHVFALVRMLPYLAALALMVFKPV